MALEGSLGTPTPSNVIIVSTVNVIFVGNMMFEPVQWNTVLSPNFIKHKYGSRYFINVGVQFYFKFCMYVVNYLSFRSFYETYKYNSLLTWSLCFVGAYIYWEEIALFVSCKWIHGSTKH